MEFNFASDKKDIGIVQLRGALDLSTISEFSEFMDQVMANPCSKIIFDLSGLSYVNSNGFGMMAAAALGEKDKNGKQIVFCNMQSSILKIYSLFGLDQVCRPLSSREEALNVLNSPSGGREDSVTFPLIRSCTECQRPSNFAKPGHYKCPHCNTIHHLNAEGQLTQVSRSKKKKAAKEKAPGADFDEVDITLPSDTQHLAKLRDFIFSFLTELFPEEERHRMAMAVDEATGNAIEHAHKYDRTKKIQLHIEVNPQRFTITVTDSGVNTFNNVVQREQVNQDILKETGRGMGLILIKQMMDDVTLKPTATWGTSITMTKYTKPPSQESVEKT